MMILITPELQVHRADSVEALIQAADLPESVTDQATLHAYLKDKPVPAGLFDSERDLRIAFELEEKRTGAASARKAIRRYMSQNGLSGAQMAQILGYEKPGSKTNGGTIRRILNEDPAKGREITGPALVALALTLKYGHEHDPRKIVDDYAH